MATRATIKSFARLKADQTNSTFPSDAECNTIIDAVATRIWSKMLRAGWKPGNTTLSVTATGASSYNIATTVQLVRAVYRVDGSTRTPLTRLKPEEEASFRSQSAGPAQVYDLKGLGTATLTLHLFPQPASGTYEVQYETRFAGFTADGDFWYGPPSSDELIAIGAAIQMLGKEGDARMMATLKADYDELYSEVCDEANWLDGPPTVRDVRAIGSRDPFDYNASEAW